MAGCKPAIASMSLGRASAHDLSNKLDQAKKHGILGIELFFEDLEHIAQRLPGGTTAETQCGAARLVRRLCDERSLDVICLQPFWQYEGLRDRKEHEIKIEKLKLWFRLAKILGTDIIQIPSSFLTKEAITDDIDIVVADLIEAADLGALEEPPIRFVYESLCWATYVDTWNAGWAIVEKVDRPNFGVCLDTFNIAGRVYGDPTQASGKTKNAESDLKASIERLVKTVDVRKVFYIQVVDAERLSEPLLPGHSFYDEEQHPRMSWSRNCRLFYGEQDRGGYLPIRDVAEALIHGLGYQGYVSMELFNRVMADPDPDIPEKLASRAAASWERLAHDLKLDATTNGVH